MSTLRKALGQVKPIRDQYRVNHAEKVQSLFTEAFTIPIDDDKSIDKFETDTTRKKELKKLLKYLKSLKLDGDIAFAGSDAGDGKIKVRNSGTSKDEIKKWISDNTPNLKGIAFGQGTPKDKSEEAPTPKGADWESLITHKYNGLLGNEKSDSDAFKHAQKFYPTYEEAALKTAKSFSKFSKTPMVQFGGGGGKENLSSFWVEKGGTNGTPKTDMYTKDFNISLKKKGGSQLASGGTGETIASFYAALQYMGVDRNAKKDIDKIMTQIENKFAKIRNKELTAGLAAKISTGEKKVDLTPKLKKDVKLFTTTEKFHKELNNEIKDTLSFEKNPLFREWYCFEAMSGYRKFSNKRSVASVCVEFDAKTGEISKFIPVTSNGKNKGLSGDTPKVSKEVKAISSKMKIFSAWKTGAGSPASVLRVIPASYNPNLKFSDETIYETPTLIGIIRDEISKDKISNTIITNLNEELEQLDEFAVIKNIFNKLKGFTNKAKSWLTGLFKKIMARVRAALEKIKQMGTKLFEALFDFFNIDVQSVKENFPSDVHGFVYGMSD